jgi:hypothetical protein
MRFSVLFFSEYPADWDAVGTKIPRRLISQNVLPSQASFLALLASRNSFARDLASGSTL